MDSVPNSRVGIEQVDSRVASVFKHLWDSRCTC